MAPVDNWLDLPSSWIDEAIAAYWRSSQELEAEARLSLRFLTQLLLLLELVLEQLQVLLQQL
jgi:hypothetical protein